MLKQVKFKKYLILNLTESPSWHGNTVRCKMFNPNILYLPVMPAQISGRWILPKSRFTFIKNVNIQNSLLWIFLWLFIVWLQCIDVELTQVKLRCHRSQWVESSFGGAFSWGISLTLVSEHLYVKSGCFGGFLEPPTPLSYVRTYLLQKVRKDCHFHAP